MSSPFSRTFPSRPDLAQQSKQAKELLERFAEGDVESRARVRAALPDKPRITLADAQFVIAREYGFVNWAALKRHIESVVEPVRSPIELVHEAFHRRDASAVRRLLREPPIVARADRRPVFSFNSPAIVTSPRTPRWWRCCSRPAPIPIGVATGGRGVPRALLRDGRGGRATARRGRRARRVRRRASRSPRPARAADRRRSRVRASSAAAMGRRRSTSRRRAR